MQGFVVFSTLHGLQRRNFAAPAPQVVEKSAPRLWHPTCLTTGRMGFSFSGLSLVTAAAAELGTGDVVKNGAGSGHQGPKPFLSTGEPAREEEGGSTDSDSGWPLPALCACADGRPSQLQDALSQVSLFSSIWTSALGASEPESSSAGHDSVSILTSEELLSARGASQERPPAVLAANGEAVAAAAGDLLGTRRHLGSRASGNAVNSDHLALLRDAGLLRPSPAAVSPATTAVGETITNAADAASEVLAMNRDGLAGNVAAMLPGAEAAGAPASVAAPQSLDPSNAGSSTHPLQTLPHDAISRLPGSLPDGTAADRVDDHFGPVFGSKASRPESGRIALPEETAEPTRHIPSNNIADSFAAVAVIAKSTTPNMAASGSAPQPAASHADTLQAMPHSASGMASVDAPGARATQAMPPQSEIAFQAEIQLNNSQGASDAAVSNPQRDALARWTTHIPRGEVPANAAANRTQQGESKGPAESAETLQPIAFRRTGDHSDAGGSSLSQDHASGNLDRGTQQTTPLGPSVMAAKPAAESTLLSRPSTIPAAAQLDSAAPATPPETGQAARSIALKIQSDDGAANVVLTDRGGQVHVTVRSSDPALTQSLRSDLGSLAGGLQQNGFDVKLWSPSPGASADSEGRGNSSEQSGQDDLRGQTRHRHSPDDAEQRNRRQSEWNEEFD